MNVFFSDDFLKAHGATLKVQLFAFHPNKVRSQPYAAFYGIIIKLRAYFLNWAIRMKIVEFGIFAMLLFVLVYAASPPKKVMFVDIVAPKELIFHGTYYADNSFEGFGIAKGANGRPTTVRLWDMR